MSEGKLSTDLGDVIPILDDMKTKGVIGHYAIGGAFAAIIHSEPISPSISIFSLFSEPLRKLKY